ncbi:MAG: bile acid:sodium symporter [Cytophagales bacterium]|nr:MAG: bile acid:sodium symporter [Cytophagales bacterium]
MLARFGLDWFIFALLGMIALARVWPEPGLIEGPLSLSALTNYGVSLIFFFYGLKLNLDKLKAGLSNYRLHLLIHGVTFVVFPALVLGARTLLVTPETELLWVGVFFLAALPSTVSSSVVMVSIAGGNLPAAIFNASISSLIGVFLTPLWMSLILQNSPDSFDLGGVVLKLAVQVVVPVVLGVLLNKRFGAWADRYKTPLRLFDQITILLIVYTSFCESFALNLFRSYSAVDLLVLSAGMLLLFFGVYGLILLICRGLRFSRPDEITALFCGSKKSLVQGSVMAKVLFAGSAAGVALLPIMIYHALQLIVASVLAQRMARRS